MNLTSWYISYIILMVLSATSSNWLSMWTVLELSSWITLVLMLSDTFNADTLFKLYFMFSVISIGILMMWLSLFYKQEWIMFLFAFKMAIPPCHWWLGWVMKKFKWKMMWWFTTVHKFIPMMFSLLFINSFLLIIWALVSTIWSLLSMWGSMSLFMLMFYSSCMHSAWMWAMTYDLLVFLLYFVTYTMMMSSIFWYMESWDLFQNSKFFSYLMLMLMGLPSSLLFFMKILMSSMYSFNSILYMWLLLLLNIGMIFPYSQMLWISSNNNFILKFCSMRANSILTMIQMTMVLFQFVVWPLLILKKSMKH